MSHATLVEPQTKKKVKSSIGSKIVTTLLVLLFVFGAWITITYLVTGDAPPAVKQTVGQATTDIKHAVSGGDVTVRLGVLGDQPQVELCDGTFTEMTSYKSETLDVLPTFIAHNGCGGDVILPLSVGSTLNVVERDGTTNKYVVLEERHAPQLGGSTLDIQGMPGELILQTCYWDDMTMKFISVERVDKSTESVTTS